jgi:signal peptidase II
MNQPRNPLKYLLFSLLLVSIDQASKMLVHQYMEPGFSGQIALIGDWFKLHYVLNPGMAFGMQLGHEYGKLFLTLFRLVAMGAIAWYLVNLARRGAAPGLLWALAMILAGAVGNVIDSTFYGVLLGNAPYGSTTPWFHGQVIDMIFVDFWEGFVPDWVPVWGGQYYSTPIFNIADACIFVGVCTILIFQSTFFTHNASGEVVAQIDDVEDVVAETDALSLQDTSNLPAVDPTSYAEEQPEIDEEVITPSPDSRLPEPRKEDDRPDA